MNRRQFLQGSALAAAILPLLDHPETSHAMRATSAHSRGVTPIRLTIPAIGIDAAIESVGKTAAGQMGVPQNVWNVAWYNRGPLPGTPGNAVISGHYDDATGPAVFYTLDQLDKQDQVVVTLSNGNPLFFVVIDKESYEVDHAPVQRIFGFNPQPNLNIITCNGSWNPKAHTYNRRLVIFTRLDHSPAAHYSIHP